MVGERDNMAEIDTSSSEFQDELESKARGFGKGKYGRILKMAHTPTKEEYVRTMYVVALGIAAIGAIGFGIWWVMSCLPTYF